MRKWIPVFLLFICLLGGIWFWSLGSLPDAQTQGAKISSSSGDVRVRHAGSEKSAHVGDALVADDVVITGNDGQAVIDWNDQGESRLSTSTEVVISKLSESEDGSLILDLRLNVGRIWSRIESLLDIDGGVTVETSDVVATVRGTAFDLEKTSNQPTTLWVSDSVVETSGPTVASTSDGLLVTEGSMAKFGGSYRTTSTLPISASSTLSQWFITNREADKKFMDRGRQNLRMSLGLGRQQKTGLIRGLINLSEGARGRLSPTPVRDRLAARSVLRRLLSIRDAAENGNPGQAADDFTTLEREVRQRLETKDPAAIRVFRLALMQSRQIFEDVNPESPAYHFKQSLEEARERVAVTPEAQSFVRLLSVDSRLNEAARALEDGKTDLAVRMIAVAEQTLDNTGRENGNRPGIDKRLLSKQRALSARAAALRQKTVTLPETSTGTTMLIETKTQIFINGKPL